MTLAIMFKRQHISPMVILLSILPIIDSLNGYASGLPIGTIYKLFLCMVLLLNILNRGGKIRQKNLMVFLGSTMYVLSSMGINSVIFGDMLLNADYPIKLIFNIAFMILLIENVNRKFISGDMFYTVLDYSSWILIACFLIPYILGVGNRVYSGDIGYKAFFISQNELSIIVVLMTFFIAYRLICSFYFVDLVRLGLLVLCGMLLNTKTTIFACLIAVIMWFFHVIASKGSKVKIGAIIALAAGCYILRDNVLRSLSNAVLRFSTLQEKYYEGSVWTSFLSGRNYQVNQAWKYLNEEHFIFRLFFGNGFCSNHLTEMDLIDIFYYLGILGLVCAVVFLIWVLKVSIRNTRFDRTIIRPMSFVILSFLLMFGGHVLFMAMSGCYFIIYCCFLIYYE